MVHGGYSLCISMVEGNTSLETLFKGRVEPCNDVTPSRLCVNLIEALWRSGFQGNLWAKYYAEHSTLEVGFLKCLGKGGVCGGDFAMTYSARRLGYGCSESTVFN